MQPQGTTIIPNYRQAFVLFFLQLFVTVALFSGRVASRVVVSHLVSSCRISCRSCRISCRLCRTSCRSCRTSCRRVAYRVAVSQIVSSCRISCRLCRFVVLGISPDLQMEGCWLRVVEEMSVLSLKQLSADCQIFIQ